MQPVNHCIDYYQHLIQKFQPKPKSRIRDLMRLERLQGWKHHYEILNARLSLRDEDAYNKLLEAGLIDADELDNPEPTALQHYIDQLEKRR